MTVARVAARALLRDRWNVYPKLTLDLGLRWEFYPIMQRADGRGLDRLDLTTRPAKLDVLIAGRGGNPQTNGLEAGLDNFAPRARRASTASTRRRSSAPATG